MKHKKTLTVSLLVLSTAVFLLIAWYRLTTTSYDSFDIGSEGLICVKTQQIYQADDTETAPQYYAIADHERYKPCDPFEPDESTVYNVPLGCFCSYIDHEKNKVLNRLDHVAITDEHGNPLKPSQVINDIFKQVAALEHDLLKVRIIDISGEYFVYVELNVNLWTPCSLYYYNQENHELIRLYEFSDRETLELYIVSVDRLHNLH